jgi:hypothetical protein
MTYPEPLPDSASEGEAGHIDDHNQIVAAVRAVDIRLNAAELALPGKAATHSHPYDAAGSAAAAQAAAVQRANHTGSQLASTISDFNTAVRTNRLDQMAAPTAAVAMGSQRITGLGAPTASTDAATKGYVDAAGGGVNAVDVEAYGAVADGAACWLISTSSASTTLLAVAVAGTFTDVPFKDADVGKTIRISPANFSTATVTRTITAVASDGMSATINSAPGFTSGAAIADWGGTDNTAAIQAAIDDANGRIVRFGPGVYRVTGELILRNGTRLQGVGWGWLNGVKATGTTQHQNIGTTIVLSRGVDDAVLSNDPAVPTHSVTIRGMRIIGSTEPSAAHGTVNCFGNALGAGQNVQWVLDDLDVVGGKHAFYGYYMGIGYITDSNLGLTRLDAMRFENCYDSVLRGVSALVNTVAGQTGSAIYIDSASHGFVINGCLPQWGKYSLYLAGDGHTVTGNRFDSAEQAGIYMDGAYQCTVSGNNLWWFASGLGMSSGIRAGIAIAGNTRICSVVGNVIGDADNSILVGVSFGGTGSYNAIGPNAIGQCGTARLSNTNTGSNNTVTGP